MLFYLKNDGLKLTSKLSRTIKNCVVKNPNCLLLQFHVSKIFPQRGGKSVLVTVYFSIIHDEG